MTAEGMIECRFSEHKANIEILSRILIGMEISSECFLGLGDELVFRFRVRPGDKLRG